MTKPDTTGTEPGPAGLVYGSRAWPVRDALWLVALAFVIALLGSLGIRGVLSRGYDDTVATLLVGCVLTLGYAVQLILVRAVSASHGLVLSETIGLTRPCGPARAWVSLALGGALAARAFAAVYGLVVERLGVHLSGADSDPFSVFPGGYLSVIVMLAILVLIAPFAEEVVFRGVLLPALGARWGTIAAVAISSAVFAAFHASVYLLLPIFIAAAVFGALAVRFRSLWPAFLAHATFNGLAAVVVLVLKGQGMV